jgi:RNA polymerase sigma-70 factor (ECF subfamily)
MKRVRRDRDRFVSSAELDREARTNPEDLLLRRRLHSAIDDLPDALRPTFIMHELEGFPLQEIADAFEVPIGTIKARVSRAREKLREALGDVLAPERGTR